MLASQLWWNLRGHHANNRKVRQSIAQGESCMQTIGRVKRNVCLLGGILVTTSITPNCASRGPKLSVGFSEIRQGQADVACVVPASGWPSQDSAVLKVWVTADCDTGTNLSLEI